MKILRGLWQALADSFNTCYLLATGKLDQLEKHVYEKSYGTVTENGVTRPMTDDEKKEALAYGEQMLNESREWLKDCEQQLRRKQ